MPWYLHLQIGSQAETRQCWRRCCRAVAVEVAAVVVSDGVDVAVGDYTVEIGAVAAVAGGVVV